MFNIMFIFGVVILVALSIHLMFENSYLKKELKRISEGAENDAEWHKKVHREDTKELCEMRNMFYTTQQIICDKFLKSETPEEFCDWIYNYYINGILCAKKIETCSCGIQLKINKY